MQEKTGAAATIAKGGYSDYNSYLSDFKKHKQQETLDSGM